MSGMSSDFQALVDQILGIQGKSKATKVDPSSPFGISTLGQTNPTMNSNIKMPNVIVPSGGKDKKDNSGFKPNFFDMLSGTFGQLGGAITDNVYTNLMNVKDKDKSTSQKIIDYMLKGNMGATLAKGVANGGKQQWKNWTDGKASWGDVPLIGMLNGMDKGWKRGQDIMKDVAGVDNRWGQVGGGIGIDIALDPLTYLTGGLTTATKLGKTAELKEIAKLTKSMNLGKKFKNADEFKQAAEQAIRSKAEQAFSRGHADSISVVAERTRKQYSKFPNLVDDMVKKKVDEHKAILTRRVDAFVKKKVDDISNQIDTARNTVFNENINKIGMSIPFSNKATVGIADVKNKGIGKALYRSEATVNAKLVDDLLKTVTTNKPEQLSQLSNAIKSHYKIQSFDELTKTQFDEVFEKFAPLQKGFKSKGLPDANVTMKPTYGDTPDISSSVDDVLKGMDKKPTGKNPFTDPDAVIKGGKVTEPRLPKDADVKWKTEAEILPKGNPDVVDANKNKEFYQRMGELLNTPPSKMTNAKTGFEHWMDTKNPFNARTLKTGDKFVNSMGDDISDAHSRKLGETAMYERGMANIEKFVKDKNITPDVMKEAIYHLEGKAPESLGANWKASDKAIELANKLKPLLDEVGSDDITAGVLSKARENYFPHVLNRSDEDMAEILAFDKKSGLNGLNSANKFDKKRKTFETIADRDNYVEKLAKAIAKETDTAVKESLQKQMDRVADMFDMDVVSTLTRRIGEGVRSRAMKQMQTNLSKYGMLKTIQKGSGDVPPTDYHKVDADEARKLGLGEGSHYIQKDVFEGMKRVDEIFTNQGMEKWKRHMAAIADIWRPLVTYYNPVHYTNNMIGNSIINMAAGVKLSDYKVARKLLKGWKDGKLTESEIKLMKSAYRHNVVSAGFLFDSKPTFKFDKPSEAEKFAKFVSDNTVIKKVRRKGEHLDDITRLANYVNGMSKYGSTAQAAKQVRTYLFNYNELTNVDRGMRVAVPFWNWMKNNIPLQMKLLMEMPKFQMNNERFRDLFNKDEEGADWQKEGGIKIPNADRYLTIQSPANDMSSLVESPVKYGLGAIHPVPRMGMEMWGNKKVFTGNPISYGSNDIQGEDVPDYVASNLGIGGKVYKAATGQDSVLEFLSKLFVSNTEIPKGSGGE